VTSGAQEVDDPAIRLLRQAGNLLAVCAHPDDESFGLGGILATLTKAGLSCAVICFTHGEASVLSAGLVDLAAVRAQELAAAAGVLGLTDADLLDYPDGHLAEVPVGVLAEEIRRLVRVTQAGTLLVFDEGGITGHPDHRQATAAALLAAERDDLTVLAWAVPIDVAVALNAEFGAAFLGRAAVDIDLSIEVDRHTQRAAISCHASQSTDNPVLWRRLELLGNVEQLRYLREAKTSGKGQE
jgi:LmbE family N-acetylglucosaminyl deacetylase